MDGQTDVAKLKVAFFANFANVPENCKNTGTSTVFLGSMTKERK
jgi:hypothetical protein